MTLNAVLPVAVSAAAGVGASAIPSAMARLAARALARRVLVKLIVAISKNLGSVGRGRIGPGMWFTSKRDANRLEPCRGRYFVTAFAWRKLL